MQHKNEYLGLTKVHIGTKTNLAFYSFLIIYVILVATVSIFKKEFLSLEIMNMLNIMVQIVLIFSYVLIWYGLSEISEKSIYYKKARVYVLLNAIINMTVVITINAYNIYIINSIDESRAKFIYSSMMMLIIGLAVFFIVNGRSAVCLIRGERETLHKYGADSVYVDKSKRIEKYLRITTLGIACSSLGTVILFRSTKTSLSIMIGELLEGHFGKDVLEVIAALIFITVTIGFIAFRVVVQLYIIRLTQKTYNYVRDISL